MGAVQLGSRKQGQTSPRVARRRERVREALLTIAARRFLERGISPVSVEELIAEADISRATFYGIFSNKYNLLENIINPVFDIASAAMRGLAERPAAAAVDGLIEVFLDVWATRRDGLLLMPALDPSSWRRFEHRRRELEEAILEVLVRAERAALLRNGSAQYSLKAIVETAVPLLCVYDGHPAAAALFRDALRGLLLRAH